MSMFGLALRSLRARARGFVASFLALLLGATILMSFASLLDTRTGVSGPAATTLLIMACVVGGWGLVVVSYSTLSMLALLARQRIAEVALLRGVGATPAQIGLLMVGESTVLGVLASALAAVPSVFLGRMIVVLLRDGHQLPADVQPRFGGFALGIGAGVTLVAAILATAGVARRITRGSVADALRPKVRTRRSSVPRVVGGVGLLAAGSSCAVLTLTAFSGTAPALMAIAGQGAILCAIGFGLLAPWLLTTTVRGCGAVLGRLGATGWLATLNLGGRAREQAAVLGPIILFTGIATGTLYMQGTENAATRGPKTDIAATIETLNYVVVGMIALFAAIMVVTTLVAATVDRRRELAQLRLAGSTPPQVFGLVGVESAALAALGVLAGTVASVVTAVPFSIARTGSALPSTPITVYLGVVVTACVLTLGSAVVATRQAIRMPAIQAATIA